MQIKINMLYSFIFFSCINPQNFNSYLIYCFNSAEKTLYALIEKLVDNGLRMFNIVYVNITLYH